jgi:hypothetical protein
MTETLLWNYTYNSSPATGSVFYVGTGCVYFGDCGTKSFTRNIHGSEVVVCVTFPYSLNTLLFIHQNYIQIVSRHVFGAELHLGLPWSQNFILCQNIEFCIFHLMQSVQYLLYTMHQHCIIRLIFIAEHI